ncbi:hypothetical protein EVAR_52656_1 [Eumeta japonica]|uniref:Histone-lysine N-methyltransferase SETMAR n=1 Tax=Eumeta variegata TaxID=151549 RepID=A0A4C1Z2Y6_EUMVA|nr:hypothetical protein EVAR_52656_1 [Eumeta japonica]
MTETDRIPKQNSNLPYGDYRDEPKPTKVVCERSVSKRIIAPFVNKTGYLASIALENCRTVNSDRYTTICMLEVIDELRLFKNNRKRRIILRHDNASSQTAKQTNKFLNKENVELMSNPAYSLHLASCDFFS